RHARAEPPRPPLPSRRDGERRRPSRRDSLQRFLSHLALAAVAQQLRRLVERKPARLGDLDAHRVVDLTDSPTTRPQQEEAHDLEDPLALRFLPGGCVDVAHVAELLDDPPLDAGLLPYLAHRRLGGRLAGVDPTLRERPDPVLPARADRCEHRAAAYRPYEHAAGGKLSLHAPVLPVGTCAA